MDSSDIIDFGIFEDFSITFNTSNITNIFPLNHRECIASTSKEIIRFERKIIKTRYPYIFSSCLVVPETEYIIGVTFKYGTLTVFKLSDISEPILKDYQTNHHGIFHMFYSSKSNSVITIGSGIHVFTFHYILPNKNVSIVNPKVSFTQRSSFATNYDTTILTPPPFDPEAELIYLPTSNGICPFTLDGKQLNPYTRIPATIKTVYTFNNESKELLTYDSTDGMSLWGPSDNLICHFSTAGSSLIAMLFVDRENVLILNSFNSLFYLNIKTARTFHCITLHQRPTRLFLIRLSNQPILFVCFANSMKAMKLVIPWKVWNLNVKETAKIERCDKFCESARVLVAARGSFVKLYTPKDGEKVTVATPSIAVNSTSFFYDRGIYERYAFNKEKGEFKVKIEKTLPGGQRDVLFVVLEDGRIIGFNTTVSPCDEVMNIKSKAIFLTICRYGEKWCYAVASGNSDLYILDYQNLKETHHFTVVNDRLLKFFYHYESDSIVMIFSKKTLLFDLKKGQIGDVLSIDGNNVTSLFANMLKYGYESGHIAHVEIENGRLIPLDKSGMQRPHLDAVSYFSFSLCFWISTGFDGKVILWNFLNEKICQVSFPIALRACAIMNGKRDVLVATDSEIMIIEGTSLFNKNEVDREVSEIDNFDRLKDNLSSEVIFPLPSHDEDEEESLLRSRKNEEIEYEYEEEEEVKEKVKFVSKFNDDSIHQKEGENIQKKIIVENNEEDKIKKLEAMQALNGIKKNIPQIEQQQKDNENSKNKPKKNKRQAVISRRDEKSIKNFIDSSIELEKEKNEAKPKKEKSVKKRKKETDETNNLKIEKSSEKIDKNDQIQIQNGEIKNDEIDDDNDNEEEEEENLVLRMKVDKKDKNNKNNHNNDHETTKNQQNEAEITENLQNEGEFNEPTKDKNQAIKEKETKNEDLKQPQEAKPEKINHKETKEVNHSKDSKPSFQKVEKTKPAENDKKKLISTGTQPDNLNSHSTKKEEKKEKIEKKKISEKVEPKQSNQKTTEKVEAKKKDPDSNIDDKKITKNQKTKPKPKPQTDTKSDKKPKPKNKEAKIQPNTKPPPDQSPRKADSLKKQQKVRSKSKTDQNQLNFKKEEIEKKTIVPQSKPDPLSNKRPRCPTPPLIRWKKPSITKKPLKRASTPPLKNERPIMFSIPPPNIVLDKAAILEFYGRGKTELKPLVDLINEEEERVRLSLLYYTCHVKNFGSSSRFYQAFSPSFALKPSQNSPRRNYENYRKSSCPVGPSFYGFFFFNDDDRDDRNRSDVTRAETQNFECALRKSENLNLPKFHEMKYAPPLNLIEQKKRQPQIHIPQSSSTSRRSHKYIMRWPDSDSKSGEIQGDVNELCKKIEGQKENDFTIKPPEIHHPPPSKSARNSDFESNLNSHESRTNWSLFYPNFDGCRNVVDKSSEKNTNHGNGVDLLANAVMMKVPSLELPYSSGYKRTKSVRMRSPQSRRVVPGMFFHQYEKRK